MIHLSDILNVRFATRHLLRDKQYHASEESIPKTALAEENEPDIRQKIQQLAAQIVADPDSILLDTYDQDERKKDWQALLKKETQKDDILPIDTRSRPGHKILDHYMRHFYDVRNHAGVSVKSLVTQAAVEKALMANLQMHSTPYKSEIRRMLIMTGGLGNVTKYRAVTAKAIVRYFGARRVLDPCVGWGGRLLGSLAAGASYTGCEPDPKTAASLRAILADPALLGANATILETPVETAALTGPFDLVLTSPPYYNLELYNVPLPFATWDTWVQGWLKPVILKCLGLLRPGGVSAWSVKNFRSDKAYPLADVTKEIHKEAGWTLIKTVTMRGSGRPGAARIQGGKETRGSEEETFCFRRTETQ